MTSEDNIALTEKISSSLESGWTDKDGIRLLKYVKVKYPHIKVQPRVIANFWGVGSLLKRSLF